MEHIIVSKIPSHQGLKFHLTETLDKYCLTSGCLKILLITLAADLKVFALSEMKVHGLPLYAQNLLTF